MISDYTAEDIIKRFTRRSWVNGMVIAHECDILFKPDIATITSDLKVNEYEIKVSLSDLRKELDYIDFVTRDSINGIEPELKQLILGHEETYEEYVKRREEYHASSHPKFTRYDNKYRKHRYYLYDEKAHYVGNYKPNRFYWILPKELYEKEKLRLDKLPYGVIDAAYFSSLKRVKPLHNEVKIDAHDLFKVALNLTHKNA